MANVALALLGFRSGASKEHLLRPDADHAQVFMSRGQEISPADVLRAFERTPRSQLTNIKWSAYRGPHSIGISTAIEVGGIVVIVYQEPVLRGLRRQTTIIFPDGGYVWRNDTPTDTEQADTPVDWTLEVIVNDWTDYLRTRGVEASRVLDLLSSDVKESW